MQVLKIILYIVVVLMVLSIPDKIGRMSAVNIALFTLTAYAVFWIARRIA